MPYRIKTQTKQPMLDPEDLLEWYERFGGWVTDHAKPVAAVAGVLVLIGLAWGGTAWMQSRAEAEASRIQAEAFQAYQRAVEAGRHQRTLPQEAESAYQQAITEFQRLIQEHPRTTQAAYARYFMGNAQAALGRHDDAIAAYREFLSRPAAEELVPLVTQRLAYVFWAKGNPEEALGQFERIVAVPDAANRDQAYFEMGQIFEQLGQKDRALETYNKLAIEYASSPWASEAAAKIVALGGTPPGQKTEPSAQPGTPAEPSESPGTTAPAQ